MAYNFFEYGFLCYGVSCFWYLAWKAIFIAYMNGQYYCWNIKNLEQFVVGGAFFFTLFYIPLG